MSTQQTKTAVGAHLVGGLKAPDAESAMRTTAGILGRHIRALTDGETGDRNQWIFWQLNKLTAVDGIDMAGMQTNASADNEDYREFPALSIDASVTALPARSLGYADAAEESYGTFKRLRDEGVVPADVKFQVSIPTPYATVVAWVRPEDQERFLPIYADAIADEVQAIADVVGDHLVIQYDVAVEFGALTATFMPAGDLGEPETVFGTLREAVGRTPDGVERGIHLCYGDYKHRHFTVPQDLSLCVQVANAAGEKSDFVHMPVDRDTGRNAGLLRTAARPQGPASGAGGHRLRGRCAADAGARRGGRRRHRRYGVRGGHRVRDGADRRAGSRRSVAGGSARAPRADRGPDPLSRLCVPPAAARACAVSSRAGTKS